MKEVNNIYIDRYLNPENCREKGLEWEYDTIYDPQAPKEANEEFTELIKQGWKLGKPASRKLEKNDGVGLYKPISPTKTVYDSKTEQ